MRNAEDTIRHPEINVLISIMFKNTLMKVSCFRAMT